MKITVFAQIIANQGQSDALFKILKQLVTDTHTEAGCIEYKLHHSLDDENIFWMYEIWQSQAALDEHMASAHFQAFVAQTANLISRADINKSYAC